MASFADPSDLTTYYDARVIRERLSDSGTPVAQIDLSTNPVVLALLARATETILSYARKGNRYSEAELQELADSPTAGYAVTGLTCDLAFGYLCARRGVAAADMDRLAPQYRMALATLQQLANGEEVFARIDGDAHPDAGTPRTADLTRQTTSLTLLDSWSAQANLRNLPQSPVTRPYGGGSGYPGW